MDGWRFEILAISFWQTSRQPSRLWCQAEKRETTIKTGFFPPMPCSSSSKYSQIQFHLHPDKSTISLQLEPAPNCHLRTASSPLHLFTLLPIVRTSEKVTHPPHSFLGLAGIPLQGPPNRQCRRRTIEEIVIIVLRRASLRKMPRKQWWQLAMPARNDAMKRESKERGRQRRRERRMRSRQPSMLAMIAERTATIDLRVTTTGLVYR